MQYTIYRPDGKGPFPTIVLLPGGYRNFGAINEHMEKNVIAPFVRNGFLVVGIGCREHDEYGGRDYEEVETAIYEIRRLPEVNESRIGLYGISRGGMMAYLLMQKLVWVRCVATLGGLANLERNALQRPEMAKVYQEAFGATEEGYRKRSAVCWTHKMYPIPLLLLHGADDDRVSVQDCLEMTSLLHKKQHPIRTCIFEGGDHILSTHREDKWMCLLTWFQKYLYME